MAINSSTVKIRTPDGEMSGFLARPVGDGKYPTVLVIMEAFGLNEHIKDVAGRLAAALLTRISGLAPFAPAACGSSQVLVVAKSTSNLE